MNIYLDLKKKYKLILNNIINNFKISEANKEDLSWIIKYHTKIKNIVLKKYNNIQTQKAFFLTLYIVLKKMNSDENLIYKNLCEEITKQILHEQKNNNLTKIRKENWVSFEELLQKKKELTEEEKKSNDIKEHYKMLIINLYTRYPVRRNYHDMEIIYDIKDIKKDKNYILLNANKIFIVINIDKITQLEKKRALDKQRDMSAYIEIKKKELIDIIKYSIKKYNRKYLFSSKDRLNSMSISVMDNLIRSLFKKENKKISVDYFRSAFVTYYFKKKNITQNMKEYIAQIMRNSVLTCQIYYEKNINNKEINKIQKKKINEIPKKKINEIPKKEEINKNNEYFKKYYKINKEKVNKEKYVYKLNNNQIKKPTKETIHKYKIIYNLDKKKWE
jgi:hypothetical protein